MDALETESPFNILTRLYPLDKSLLALYIIEGFEELAGLVKIFMHFLLCHPLIKDKNMVVLISSALVPGHEAEKSWIDFFLI